jgi:hypothetical protein
MAICSGVTCRVYWPIAVRAGSSLPFCGSRLPGWSGSARPDATTSLEGRPICGGRYMPKRAMDCCRSRQRSRGQRVAPICANTVLMDFVSAKPRSNEPGKRSPLSLWIAWPYSRNVPGSVKVEVGWYLPLSSAVAAVITLNVDPGG